MKTGREEKIRVILERGVEEIISRESLEKKLRSGKKLRIKFGIDPTAPALHLGHAVILRKLRQFQDAGHEAVLIIGDFTAKVGDPSGQSETRRPLAASEIRRNLKKYLRLAGKVLDLKKAKVFYNSKWFGKNGLEPVLKLAQAGTVQQLLRRADFQKRIEAGRDVTLLEVFYPLLQGYDSVMVRSDVELGGTDQKFNLLAGRRVQRHFGFAEQEVMTLLLLEGTDGAKKMSKSYGNYIALDAKPAEMFGKVMSIPDALISKYALLLTDLNVMELAKLKPLAAKELLAYEITKLYHGANKAEEARRFFNSTFREKKLPDDLPSYKFLSGKETLGEILRKAGLVPSAAEYRRLVRAGAVEINQRKVSDPTFKPLNPAVVRIGKKKFLKIVPS